MDDMSGFDCLGADDLVGDDVVTIPTVGANYTDAKTVAAVQQALVNKGYDLGTSGPSSNGVDGVFGSKTKAAIEKMQKLIGNPVTGKIDEGVIAALQVTPGVLPPGVTIKGRAALQAAVVLDAATAAEHADTPGAVQAAAQQAMDTINMAAPPPPPEVKQAAQAALVKAKAATTPAQVKDAGAAVAAAAKDAHAAIAPSWWKSPAWPGGLERWKVSTIGGGVLVGLGTILIAIANGPRKVAR